MAVPSLPTALNAGDVVSNAWVDAVRENQAWFRDDRPIFKGQGFSGVGASNSDVNTSTTTTFGFGAAGSFGVSPIINVGGWTVQGSDADPESLVVPEAGIYQVTVWGSWSANTSGYRQIRLLEGGSTTVAGADKKDAASAGVTWHSFTEYLDLAAGAQLDIQAFQNSGSTLGVAAYLSAVWMQST